MQSLGEVHDTCRSGPKVKPLDRRSKSSSGDSPFTGRAALRRSPRGAGLALDRAAIGPMQIQLRLSLSAQPRDSLGGRVVVPSGSTSTVLRPSAHRTAYAESEFDPVVLLGASDDRQRLVVSKAEPA